MAVNGMQHYAPYGDPFGTQGSLGMPFGFTGEQTDGNGLVYLRARHYAPSLGIFPSLDPFEGIPSRPMSLNGYSWVEGNVINSTDASGKFAQILSNLSVVSSALIARLLSAGICNIEDGRYRCENVCQPLLTDPYAAAAYNECIRLCQEQIPPANPAIERLVKESTVIISWGVDSDVCYPPSLTSGCEMSNTSLGTIVSGGILTHDHVDGNNSGNHDAQKSWEFIRQEYTWMRIEGINGDRYDRIDELPEQIPNGPRGTTLLPVSGNGLGEMASSTNLDLATGDTVYFAFVPGSNFAKPFVNYNRVSVGLGTYRGRRDDYRHALLQDCSDKDPINCPNHGDSGAGFFNHQGLLVGVYRGKGYYGLLPQYQSLEFVAAK